MTTYKDIAVISKDEDGKLSFRIDKNFIMLDGQSNLVQNIIKRLFTAKTGTYGSSFFNLVKNSNISEVEEIKQVIPIAIDDVADQIKSQQMADSLNGVNIPDSEWLISLSLYKLEFDSTYLLWDVKLKVTTKVNTFNLDW